MNYTHIKRVFIVSFILINSFLLRAQDHIQFKNYTIDDGLSQSSISCVMQDKLGTLWIGTQDGINRFNGKNFEVFTADKGYDISNEFINTGYQDSKANLWFGTRNGLVKQNPNTVQFSSYILDSLNTIDIYSITEDINGNLWVGTGFGSIYLFDTKNELFQLISKDDFTSKITAITQLNNHDLVFVSETDGVIITDSNFENKRKLKINFSEDLIFNSLINSPEYDLVFATNLGVFYYDEDLNIITPYNTLFSVLNDIDITDLIYLSKDRILVSSDKNGLFLVTKDDDSLNLYNYSADIFQKGSLLTNKIKGLFLDKKGIVWIYSDEGLSSYNPNFIGFKGVGISAYPNNGLPSQNVWGFNESEDGQFLYIAADHGVSAYDRVNHQFYHYYRTTDDADDIMTLHLQIIKKNHLLIGCVDGLFELIIDEENPSKYEFIKINYPDNISKSFEFTYKIIPFKNKNQFLIGTKGGVILYDFDTKFTSFLYHQQDENNTIGAGAIRYIFKNNEKYYASPSSGGIYEIIEENNQLKALVTNEFTFFNNNVRTYITSAYKENESIFWFGTLGKGLYKADLKTKKVINYDKSKGLLNNVIYGIESVPSNSRYIWLSTNKGVVAFNTKRELFYNFSEKDGLMSNELNQGAAFVSKNEEIYFGGIKGFNYFNPDDVFQINPNIHVYFSDLEINNVLILPSEEGILKQNIAFTKKIVLPYNKKSLKLRFFADDLSNPDRIEYMYELTGKNEITEELGSINELRFTSLSPGVYELLVYARIANGSWNKYPAKLIIELERPFWLKAWFYVVSTLIIALITYLLIRKRIEENRRRRVRLEMRIAERTRELRKKNEQIRQQRNQLIKQTEELEREKEKSERILNNVLPKETAKELKKDGRAAAREFKKVSIMFTDFVGFSRIAEGMTARELVSILDMHFSKFDEIIEKNNLEKIKTIGDAYMAAGGVPIRNKTNPINTALAAVQIKYYMLEHKEEQIKKGEQYWQLRIGINTGSVSAGVIGTKRYAYDIWGSSVNRAQRMEELCEPEKIAVTQATYDHISPYFVCKELGKVKTKSGLKINMYELVHIKPELSKDGLGIEPNESFDKLVNLHYYSKINYVKAERFILSKLKEELDPKLHYHSYDHSKDVTRQAERIAINEGITDEDLFLLKSAASFHDAGFIEEYDKNEKIGARLAEEILPNFGYTKEHIERIKQLIYVTEVPHKPTNLLEQIICDADLDYLGRDDFFLISDRLRRELREHGKINSDREWDKMQVKFFEKHHYFTKTAIETRLEKKLKHLEVIKKRLVEDNYVD